MNYVEGQTDKMVMQGHGSDQIKTSIQEYTTGIRNPFFDLFHWCKQEIFDIESLAGAVKCKDAIKKSMTKNETKILSNNETLEKMAQGKTTSKTILKNDHDKYVMKKEVEFADKEA